MRFQLLRIFCGLVIASITPHSFAWGPEGHEIVARIAELHLTPTARKQMDRLLATTSTNHHRVHIWYSGVCNWPDFIRHSQTNTAPWHFVDIPYNGGKYDADRDCVKHGGCIVGAISRFQKELAASQAPVSNRVEALKFLIHFVGDISQPLHCAERNNDQGGNLCMVLFPGRTEPVRLHYVWDGLLLQRSMAQRHLDNIGYADSLNEKITEQIESSWAKGTPEDWANESHQIAVNNVYAGIPIQEAPFALSDEYVTRSQALIDSQLMKGGIRAARLLNEVFK